MNAKTNAMRALEAHHVDYQAFYFRALHLSAEEVADEIGLPHHIVFKTLVVLPEKGRPMLVMLPGPSHLDLRQTAREVGAKSVAMASQREAERLTGLQVGGISALALLNKRFDVFIDKAALELEEIVVSAGKRGINLRLKVSDLIAVTNATPIQASGEAGASSEH